VNCLPSLDIGFGGLLLAFGVVFALWVLWKIQRSPKPIDFVDLLVDEAGKASWTRMGAIGAFLFSTWVIAHRELNGTLDAAFFTTYVGAFVGGAVAYQFRPARAGDGSLKETDK
jgi:hypothetical protein